MDELDIALARLTIVPTIACPSHVAPATEQTPEWRESKFGSVAGGKGSMAPEAYQKKTISEGTRIPCEKSSHTRIDLERLEIVKMPKFIDNPRGLEFTEDFDAVQIIGAKRIYINLKSISGTGGGQTRSVREIYWFIDGQLQIAPKYPLYYFANILDGAQSPKYKKHFDYLMSKAQYEHNKKQIYIGDLKDYFAWFKTIVA